MTISIPRFDSFYLGALVALYERAVGFYGSLVNINAYHQPGVEAGKKAAALILELQAKAWDVLQKSASPLTAEQVAIEIGADPEETFHVLVHLANNRQGLTHNLSRIPSEDTFAAA